jgi:hypothetical protein
MAKPRISGALFASDFILSSGTKLMGMFCELRKLLVWSGLLGFRWFWGLDRFLWGAGFSIISCHLSGAMGFGSMDFGPFWIEK